MIGISKNREKHIFEVARLMYKQAKAIGWDEEKCREMFTLGLVHDLGYEFCEKQEEHPAVGGTLLRFQGYKYWREVKYHGMLTSDYSSPELDLLNKSDICVDSLGNIVTAEERLNDIGKRYGYDSSQYKDALILAEKLKLI